MKSILPKFLKKYYVVDTGFLVKNVCIAKIKDVMELSPALEDEFAKGIHKFMTERERFTARQLTDWFFQRLKESVK